MSILQHTMVDTTHTSGGVYLTHNIWPGLSHCSRKGLSVLRTGEHCGKCSQAVFSQYWWLSSDKTEGGSHWVHTGPGLAVVHSNRTLKLVIKLC